MKVAVYAIAKNESSNLDGWYSNISNADHVLILDTGSTDDTVDKAKSLGISVFEASITPWDEARAKNVAMSLLPKDIDFCICLDLDEHITDPNWKTYFSEGMKSGMYLTTSIGTDGINEFHRPVRNVHPRFGYYWKGFRAALCQYPKYEKLVDNPQLPIFTTAVAGDQDRFDNRDPMYVQAFLNEVIMLETDKSEVGNHLQTALSHLALSYYEIEDYDNFKNTFRIFYKNLNDMPSFDNKLPFVEFLDYAAAMVIPDIAEKTYLSWIDKSQHPMIPFSRLIMFLILSGQNELAGAYISKYTSTEGLPSTKEIPTVMDAKIIIDQSIIRSIEICKALAQGIEVSEADFNFLIDVYSNIGWGKRHKDLALKAIDYGKI